MGLWDNFKNLFNRKTEKGYSSQLWHPVGGYTSSSDYWGRRKPNPADLMGAFSDTVYSCASLITDSIVNTPIRLFVKTDKGQPRPKCQVRPVSKKAFEQLARTKHIGQGTVVEEVVTHPVLDLLNCCNGDHNYVDFISLTNLYLEVLGNAYWYVKEDGFGLPQELYLLPAQFVTPQRDENGLVVAWKVGQGIESIVYPKNEIIHFKFPNIEDPYGIGFSPLQAAWDRVQIGFKEIGYLDASLSNNGRPDAVLSPDEPISPFEAERLAKEFIQRFRGQGSGGIFVSDGPMKLTPLSWPAKDLAELQLYQVIKTAVCNCYHVPVDVFELGEANRATAEAVLYSLAVHAVKPRLIRLVEKLNERLIPYYDSRLFFQADNPVPEDRQFELTERQMLLAQGVVTRNEVRQLYGFAETEWADEPLTPPGMLPALSPDLDVDASEPVPQEPAKEDRSGQSPGLAQLQSLVYGGQLPREAGIANVQLTFGFTPEQAAALFPDIAPVQLVDHGTEPDPGPGTAPKSKALEVPAVRQQGDYDCGAAAVCSVLNFFGINKTEEECIAALGTTEEDGTSPEAIIDYLGTVGLRAEARNDLTIADLGGFVAQGSPVICCVQMYEDRPQDVPEEISGHWIVVTDANDETVSFMDPSAGANSMPTMDFLARWEDMGGEGQFIHFGIAVSQERGKAYRRKTIHRRSPVPFVKALQRVFKKQAETILGRIKTVKALPHDWFDLATWTDDMAEVMRPVIALYYDHAAKQTVGRIGASWDLLKVVQPRLQDGIDKATFQFCEETNKTTSLEIDQAVTVLKKELAEGVAEGDYQNALTKRVQSVFERAEVERAYQIAITETSRGQHAAQELVAQESGIVKGKKWLLSSDACPDCKPLANKTVPLGESFTTLEGRGVYNDVPYPPLHPGCRCTILEVLD